MNHFNLNPLVDSEKAQSLAETFGTPIYLYDEACMRSAAEAVLAFPNAYGLTARFAMKSSPNKSILQLFDSLGLHIDASSGHEVKRAIYAGIAPSKISLSAQEIPEDLDGKSLLPLILGEVEKHHDSLAWALNRNRWAFRMGKWKLTQNAGWKHSNYKLLENGDAVRNPEIFVYSNEPQLFNLEEDISETTNLLEKFPEIVKEIRNRFEDWDRQMSGPLTSEGKPKNKKI